MNEILNKIKKIAFLLRNLLIWLTPFFIFLIVAFIAIYFLKGDFDKYVRFIGILIWPAALLIALFFFRKVITYLFFSMDEFNFFGLKGSLKNVTEVIEERVQQKLKEEKDEEKRQQDIQRITGELKKTAQSKEDYLKLAQQILEQYKNLSDRHAETMKELEDFRQQQAKREAMRTVMRERLNRRRVARYHLEDDEPSLQEIDAAGDAYIQQEIDKARGK